MRKRIPKANRVHKIWIPNNNLTKLSSLRGPQWIKTKLISVRLLHSTIPSFPSYNRTIRSNASFLISAWTVGDASDKGNVLAWTVSVFGSYLKQNQVSVKETIATDLKKHTSVICASDKAPIWITAALNKENWRFEARRKAEAFCWNDPICRPQRTSFQKSNKTCRRRRLWLDTWNRRTTSLFVKKIEQKILPVPFQQSSSNAGVRK